MNEKPLAGRTIAILVANGFDEVQFTGPQKHLIELGAAVKVVSRVKSLVNGWYEGNWGHFFPVNVDASETLAIDFDGLVIPGGIRSVDKLLNTLFKSCSEVLLMILFGCNNQRIINFFNHF